VSCHQGHTCIIIPTIIVVVSELGWVGSGIGSWSIMYTLVWVDGDASAHLGSARVTEFSFIVSIIYDLYFLV